MGRSKEFDARVLAAMPAAAGRPAGPSEGATAPRPCGLARVFGALLNNLALWQERAEQRADLAEMDERMLKDIGVSAADAWKETRKPFWRA